MLPTKIFFTKGVGKSKEKLTSFELALRSAGIAPYNLLSVSSIYPAGVKRISREEGIKCLKEGRDVCFEGLGERKHLFIDVFDEKGKLVLG